MTLDEIFSEWAKDSQIDRIELGDTARQVPVIHNKYYRLFAQERLLLRKAQENHKQLFRTKYEYYLGQMSLEEQQKLGYPPFYQKVLKSEVDTYINADDDIVKSNLKVALHQEKVDALESIVRSINNRGYLLKTILDFERFRSGAA